MVQLQKLFNVAVWTQIIIFTFIIVLLNQKAAPSLCAGTACKALCTSTVVLWPTLAIACSSLDAGHMIDGQDRATADFRDTELSSN